MSVICGYCSTKAKLVGGIVIYPHRQDLEHKRFWLCDNCDAYVGTHLNSPTHKPLGVLANPELRSLKSKLHKEFDKLWKMRGIPKKHRCVLRRASYRWLAKQLRLPKHKCHIGYFNNETCKKALELLKEKSMGIIYE